MSKLRLGLRVGAAAAALMLAVPAAAQTAISTGPYNVELPEGGDSLLKPFRGQDAKTLLPSDAGWSMSGWVQATSAPKGRAVIAAVGDPATAQSRYLAVADGKLELWSGGRRLATAPVRSGGWVFVAASGEASGSRLYLDGREVARGPGDTTPVRAVVVLGPRELGAGFAPFGGRIAGLEVAQAPLSAQQVKARAAARLSPELTAFETGAPAWPVQVRQMYGQTAPQDPWTLPKSKAAFSAPVAKPAYAGPAVVPGADGGWMLKGWKLAEAPKVAAPGSALSQPGFDARTWYAATVPGTVLTTLVDRGVYPDPEYGLNNLAIPESLNKQAYWYRTEFTAPAGADRHFELTFKGINYAAEVWLNGEKLGDIRGAFIRGRFDVTGKLKPGQVNALAVKVSPPPHPGIAHEESLTAGVGENGGMQALDGPTFIATEGWDWIPSVRDRNTGLWQDVTLKATGQVAIDDPQIVTTLPKGDNSLAEVEVDVPVVNHGAAPVAVTVRVAFDDVSVARTVAAPPGESTVVFRPAEFPQLAVKNPKLWWPNGYGDPALHAARITVEAAGQPSDEKAVRFGMRQITYELSLMDSAGKLRRVEVDFAKARELGQHVVDVSHEGIRKVPGGWAESLTPGAETSPAVRPLTDERLTPYLVLKVNGVRIASRGGNWGTDDWLKRVDRARLEPYFRLHRDAHLNTIRNWVGQNTEDVFYDLADEYGLLVLNDFWASTQDFQLEPQDVPLFLANAEDVVKRYRNHPSIALWFGRNEGVPQPILNEGLDALIRKEDGTRWYTGSSNRVELQNSGPYNYREPETYFTEHAKGYSVESGTPSFPTKEAFEAALAPEDRWPISDAWAYHDWHQTGNGAVGSFMDAMAAEFGPAASLGDFERKAQMMNYVTHRAMFEGFNAELWEKTSGRLLWMTQPAWPSTMWQILSHDYDTHAAFYGVQKASEPLHAQMNLPDFGLAVVNNTRRAADGLVLHAVVRSLDNRELAQTQRNLTAPAGQAVAAGKLDLAPLLATEGVVLVKLDLRDAAGAVVSQNLYWQGADRAALQKLNSLPPQALGVSAAGETQGDERRVVVRLANPGPAAALNAKLTLQKADGSRILPAYADDNYVSLLPGESRQVTLRYPASAYAGPAQVAVRGWNVTPATAQVSGR